MPGSKNEAPSKVPTTTTTASRPPHADNLIDLDSRPPSTAPPGDVSKDTSNQTQSTMSKQDKASVPANLLDDDNVMGTVNEKMANMNMHEPMIPEGQKPLKRADTDTNEIDEFVDAEG